MNTLCAICDTKNRLGLCDGIEGSFKYCYRPVGSLDRIKENTIIPFNSLEQLFEKLNGIEQLVKIRKESLVIKEYGKNFGLLVGKFEGDEGEHPIGFIIKDDILSN